MKLKAWQVEEEYEGYATIVFAETRNKAKYLATQYDETLHEYNYAEVRAIRIPHMNMVAHCYLFDINCEYYHECELRKKYT